MFELFIAKKYLNTKDKLNFISIISILSTLGITIGVAALIIVISVFNGFGDLAKAMLIESQPHMRIVLKSDESKKDIKKIEKLLSSNKFISSYVPYLQGKVIVSSKNNYQILDAKGIENTSNDNYEITNSLISGSLDLSSDNSMPEAVLNISDAMKLSARIGDTLSVTSFRSMEKMITNFLVIPNTKRFVVSGISKPNSKGSDKHVLYTNLNFAQNLFSTNDISGFNLKLYNYENAVKTKAILDTVVNPELFAIETWYDMNKEFYDILELERWGAFILLLLIISVATFNILGSLTMSVIEKRRDIGILRSMGASKNSILRIFMFEGILIGIIGTFTGFILGLLVCYLQMEYKLYPLDATKYIIDAIPVKLRLSDLILIPIVSMLLSFLASLYPAKRAVRLNVIDTIKYE